MGKYRFKFFGILDLVTNNHCTNTLRLRQYGHHFPDGIFKCIFLNENVWILIKILLKFVTKGPVNNIPSLVQIMVWRWPGDKPLSEPIMVSLPTHIWVPWPQWVNMITQHHYISNQFNSLVSLNTFFPHKQPRSIPYNNLRYHKFIKLTIYHIYMQLKTYPPYNWLKLIF